MGLASALSTALTGLNGAETTINVVGNNLANSSTDGFKSSEALFATQFLQTLSLGSSPQGGDGGTNPTQIGLGTQVASITPDFSQGTIQLSSSPSDLAIQGDGFFIVQGSGQQQFYTRNGSFQLNANNQLVTSTGNVLLGYGVNSDYQLDQTAPQPLSIDLGSKQVAQATQNVFFQGALTPTGDIANTAGILDSGVFGDAQFDAPDDSTTVIGAPAPDISATNAAASGNGSISGDFSYKVAFVDANGNESPAATISGPVTATNAAQIDLTNIPVDTSASQNYVSRNIYRTTDGGSTYYLVGNIPDNTTTTFDDTTADAALTSQPQLNTNNLNGNYTYRITWTSTDSTVPESRPSAPITVSVTDGRLVLSNFETPTGDYANGTINIYRNVAGQPDTFYRVASGINPNSSFTDNVQDATITNSNLTTNPAYKVLDANGPRISATTLLDNVISLNGNTYTNLFQNGTLSFTGAKGGDTLGTKNLTITDTTNVADLMSFMGQALGIQSPTADPHNPIPGDSTGKAPGISVVNGEIEVVSNNGTDNAAGIPLSAFKLTPSNGSPVQTPNLGFSSVQTADGQSAAADFIVYDSLGIPLNVRVTTVLESRDSTGTTYRWFADSPDNDPSSGANISVGTGEIKFDGNGNVASVTNSTVSIDRTHVASDTPLQFNLDFSDVSGLAADSSSLAAARQDGSAAGSLSSYNIGDDGTINGVFTNGVSRTLGQILLARFRNPDGLQALGNNDYSVGVNSGLPLIGAPGSEGRGNITAGAVELSNTDIGKNLIQLILASTAYQGNTRVISTVDNMLQVLLQLNR